MDPPSACPWLSSCSRGKELAHRILGLGLELEQLFALVSTHPPAGAHGEPAPLLQTGAGAARLPKAVVTQGLHEQLQAGRPFTRLLVTSAQLEERLAVAAGAVQCQTERQPCSAAGPHKGQGELRLAEFRRAGQVNAGEGFPREGDLPRIGGEFLQGGLELVGGLPRSAKVNERLAANPVEVAWVARSFRQRLAEIVFRFLPALTALIEVPA
jgi:hypothetical protein